MSLVTGGYKSFGTILQIKDTTFKPIGNVTKVEVTGRQVGKRNTTNLASTSESFRPTIPTFGVAKFSMQLDPSDAVHVLLDGRITTPQAALDEFKLIYPDGLGTPANIDFKGFVEKFEIKGIDEKGSTIMADLEVVITDLYTASVAVP